jgi:hypothetical protein
LNAYLANAGSYTGTCGPSRVARVGTIHVHDLASRLICAKCKAAGKRPAATLLQLESKPRHETKI